MGGGSFNPLSVILKENKLTGPNYMDWKKNLNKSINSSLEWFKYISDNCPVNSLYKLPYNYYSAINDSTFDICASILSSI